MAKNDKFNWKSVLSDKHAMISVMYHNWGVELENDSKYQIPKQDQDAMKWLKDTLDEELTIIGTDSKGPRI